VSEASDTAIMLRVRDGNVEELGQLFDRHHVPLLNFFHRMTGSRAVSEDLVQEVFVRIMRYRDNFRGDGGGFVPWMYCLARSVRIDHARRAARHDHDPLPEKEPAAEGPSALDRIERDQSGEILRRCLLQLPEDKREVLVLRCYHLKKFSEIAEVLGCTVGTAKVRAHRAIRELRRMYESRNLETAR